MSEDDPDKILHKCQDEHTFVPKHMVKLQFNWLLFWSIGALALALAALIDNWENAIFELTIWTLLAHFLVFGILTVVMWMEIPWNTNHSAMIGMLWFLSTFVLLGVVVLAITAPNLVNDTVAGPCNQVGSSISTQLSEHVIPLVSLLTITGFPSELRIGVSSMLGTAFILMYFTVLTICEKSLIDVYSITYVNQAMISMAILYGATVAWTEASFRIFAHSFLNLETFLP